MILKKNGSLKDIFKSEREVEFSGTYYNEREHGKCNTPRRRWRKEDQRETFNNLPESECIGGQGVNMDSKESSVA